MVKYILTVNHIITTTVDINVIKQLYPPPVNLFWHTTHYRIATGARILYYTDSECGVV